MRVVVLPFESNAAEEQLTARLVCAIADEIWRLCSRHNRLDWPEVEAALAAMASRARAEASHAIFVRASGPADGAGGAGAASGGYADSGKGVGTKPARALVEAS